MPKALIVVTNISKYPNKNTPTGLWLGEAVHFYEKMAEAGWNCDFVSPKGGYTPIEPNSLKEDYMTQSDWKYYQSTEFMAKLGATMKPSQVKAQEYKCIYYAGGHGVVWDFNENEELQKIAMQIYENGGVVSSVCHGAAGILNLKDKNGEPLVKGKKVTCFSNEQQTQIGLQKEMPYLNQTQLQKRGGVYEKTDAWKEYVVSDQRVITGQNPASAAGCAKQVLKIFQ